MTPTSTRSWILAEKPTELPILTGPHATFQLVTKPLEPLKPGEVLLKVKYLSNEPALRLWIDPNISPDRLYTEPVEVGDLIKSYSSICEVLESRSELIPRGTLVAAMSGWREYAVLPAEECMALPPLGDGTVSLTHYAGIFGLTGMTAFYGLVDIAGAGPGDAVVISGAAGAVGSAAVQIAKHVLGCRKVIGIAGTEAKCKWVVETLGADACLNYKSPSFAEDLVEATKGFVEVFFDNAGGEVLDLMLTRVARDGRVAACGAIAGYNSGSGNSSSSNTAAGIKNWYHVIAMRLQIRGFVVLDAGPVRSGEIVASLIQAYQDGRIKLTEESQTVVPAKFEDVPKAWMKLFEGHNTGKLLTQLV
ncbi:hypothetical protein BX600DRAFT_484860 [Xylariales sp. PMI_506]|nr:hypothetical protein BX600DRAFT_484860 [Xylariales sp. PMI_506]